MLTPDKYLGKNVVLRMPHAEWSGVAVAHSEDPTVLIEQPNGFRLMLPARYVELKGGDDQ